MMPRASYWRGVMESTMPFSELTAKMEKKTRSKAGKSGATARKNIYDKIKRHARDLAKEMRPENGWHSRMQAALAIKDQAVEFAKTECGIYMQGENPERTIDKWLKEMENVEFLFRRKK